MASVFETLSAIDCKPYAEERNGLTYLSWAWAWKIVKQHFPNVTSKVYETPEGLNYFTDGKTCFVKTGVTIEGQEYIEYLPVMDYRNNSIPLDKVTSFDINKSIQRSITKALARHGLGISLYIGEDLPDKVEQKPQAPAKTTKPAPKPIPTNKQLQSCVTRAINGEKGIREQLLKNFTVPPDILGIFDLAVAENLAVEEAMDKVINS